MPNRSHHALLLLHQTHWFHALRHCSRILQIVAFVSVQFFHNVQLWSARLTKARYLSSADCASNVSSYGVVPFTANSFYCIDSIVPLVVWSSQTADLFTTSCACYSSSTVFSTNRSWELPEVCGYKVSLQLPVTYCSLPVSRTHIDKSRESTTNKHDCLTVTLVKTAQRTSRFCEQRLAMCLMSRVSLFTAVTSVLRSLWRCCKPLLLSSCKTNSWNCTHFCATFLRARKLAILAIENLSLRVSDCQSN